MVPYRSEGFNLILIYGFLSNLFNSISFSLYFINIFVFLVIFFLIGTFHEYNKMTKRKILSDIQIQNRKEN